jgi:hypothetical protein
MKRLEDIDKIVSGKIGQWEASPPPQSFAQIQRRIKWVNFWKFRMKRILSSGKYLMIAASILLIIGGFVIKFFPESNNSLKDANTEIQRSGFEEFSIVNTPNIIDNQNNQQNIQSNNKIELSPSLHNNSEPEATQNENFTITSPGFTTQQLQEIYNNSNFLSENSMQNSQVLDKSPVDSRLSISQNEILFSDELLTQREEISEMYIQSDPHENSNMFMIPRTYSTPVTELTHKYSHSTITGNNWTTSAGLSAVVHRIINPTSFYNNAAYARSKILNGSEISAEFRIENDQITMVSGIGFSFFSQDFYAEKLIYHPHTDIQYIFSGSIESIDSAGYWHYYYIADSIVHFVDSLWNWSVDTSVVHVFDTNYVNQSDTMKNVNWTTHFQQISVPLLLGKTFTAGRFQLTLLGGISLGIIKANHGYVLHSEQSAYPFRTLQSVFPENYFTISAVGTLSAGYFINERTLIELKPFFIYQLNKMNIQEQNTDIQFHRLGVSAGLRFYF